MINKTPIVSIWGPIRRRMQPVIQSLLFHVRDERVRIEGLKLDALRADSGRGVWGEGAASPSDQLGGLREHCLLPKRGPEHSTGRQNVFLHSRDTRRLLLELVGGQVRGHGFLAALNRLWPLTTGHLCIAQLALPTVAQLRQRPEWQ